jgi:hypothetical protein
MITSNPYTSLDNQMDEEDEEDEYEELATCMVVASINPYSSLDLQYHSNNEPRGDTRITLGNRTLGETHEIET